MSCVVTQRAFEKRMQSFISKSRERQRLVKMRANERDVSTVHGRDRASLFKLDHKRQANVDAHPLSGQYTSFRRRRLGVGSCS